MDSLPDDGKRKKAVVQQVIAMPYTQPFGGFEQIKAAVLYTLIQSDALTLAGSAAHGGSRHETKSVST